MAAASRTRHGVHSPSRPARGKLRLAGTQDQAFTSPALESQARLAEILEAGDGFEEIAGKWSPRRTVAFLLITCGGFWGLVGFGLLKAIR